jgi:putative membrane protein
MRRATSTLIVAVISVLTSAVALADAPSDFLTKAIQGSMAQIELGKLAQKNAESGGVNALGVRLERDHARIGKILATLAQQKGVTVPVALEGSRSVVRQSLSTKHGADFDAAYSLQMVSDHQKAIALFTAAADSTDPDVSQVAKMVLPVLREDERLASSFAKLNEGNLQAITARE